MNGQAQTVTKSSFATYIIKNKIRRKKTFVLIMESCVVNVIEYKLIFYNAVPTILFFTLRSFLVTILEL